jgi:hypothetical protein
MVPGKKKAEVDGLDDIEYQDQGVAEDAVSEDTNS